MFRELIVPIDGSQTAWRALPIAARMASAVDGTLDVVTVSDRLADVVPIRRDLERGVEQAAELAVAPSIHVLSDDATAGAIARFVEERTGSMVVMSSHGHGRSAAVLGSVTDELLRLTFGPIVVVGPRVGDDAGRLDGPIAVAVDGSRWSEQIVPIAEAWTVEFGAVPWLLEVLDPAVRADGVDVMESGYTARIARDMKSATGHEIEYEVLHGTHPAESIVDFADQRSASMIFATTHGRRGLTRLRAGSVAADLVRHATVPVVLHRPPQLPG